MDFLGFFFFMDLFFWSIIFQKTVIGVITKRILRGSPEGAPQILI